MTLAWGHLGERHEWETLRSAMGPGIVRRPREGAEYDQAPPLPDEIPTWKIVDEDRLEMDCGCALESIRSFGKLCEGLRQRRKELRKRKANLPLPDDVAQLDQVAQKLLDAAEYLHRRRCGLGIITPENVFSVRQEGNVRLLLPDVGFVLTTDRIVRPQWFVRLKDEQKASLGDEDLREVLRNGVVRQESESFSPQTDVRLLSRLFCLGLSGKSAHVPVGAADPDGIYNTPVWTVLDQAISGRITTISALRERLDTTPLSLQFRPKPLDPLRWRTRIKLLIFAFVMLLFLGTVGTYVFAPDVAQRYINNGRTLLGLAPTTLGSPNSNTPGLSGTSGLDCSGASKPAPLPDSSPLKQPVAAWIANPPWELEPVMAILNVTPTGPDSAVERAWQASVAQSFAEKWRTRVVEARRKNYPDPNSWYFEELPALRSGREDLRKLREHLATHPLCDELNKKVDQCLSDFDQFLPR